jgi:putative DNA primase/helicase
VDSEDLFTKLAIISAKNEERMFINDMCRTTEGKRAKDIRLVEKLTMPEELSGLLNLALIALKKLHKDGGFKDLSVEKIRKEYDENANIVKAFLYDKCVIDLTAPEYYTLTANVYYGYVNFCEVKNQRPLEMNVFGKKLAEQGIER